MDSAAIAQPEEASEEIAEIAVAADDAEASEDATVDPAQEAPAEQAEADDAPPQNAQIDLAAIAALPLPEMVARGQDILASGDGDTALVIFEEAARRGHGDAAVAVAELYDPGTWATANSPFNFPNAERAAEWYERAAELGVPEAAAKAVAMRGLAGSQGR